MTKDEKYSIDICIPTYKRNDQLKRLLLSIERMNFSSTIDIKLIIIDNYPNPITEAIIRELSATYRFRIYYYQEYRKGVVHVRNTAIEKSNSKYLAFIDDDEIASTDWIDAAIKTMITYHADIVIGQVYPEFSENTPDWIKFNHGHLNHKTGHILHTGSTNNVLFNKNSIPSAEFTFNEKYSLTGGEDTELFFRLNKLGLKIVFSENAIVYDPIPISRQNLYWYTRRNFRVGQTNASIFMPNNIFLKITWALKRCAGIILGFSLFIIFFLISRKLSFYYLFMFVRNSGQIADIIGYKTNEYI